MGKTLVIAEKPSVARDIANVIGATQKGDNCLIGEKYVVSWAIGHLVTLAEPEDYDIKYKTWSLDTLPMIPEQMQLKAITKTRAQLRTLHRLMHSKEIDDVICATDSGREGELIFRYIYEITKCKKPFCRLWISSMTKAAIQDGFAHLQDGKAYDLLYHSARSRAKADWLVGMNASRAYTLQYHTLLSIGRVQTPTLALIVDRQKEIDAFVPQTYYEVLADFGSFTGLWVDKKDNTKIMEQTQAEEIIKRTKGQNGVLTALEKEEKQQLPPLLYDLTELQRECNKKFGFSAKKTLDLVQGLYEKKKMVTYPRTDSRYLSDDMIVNIKQVLEKLAQSVDFAQEAKHVLAMPKLPLSKRILDNSKVTDHHAIIPTDVRIHTDHLSVDEKRVYFLIAGRFLSVFYPPYRYEVTKAYSQIGIDTFLSRGKVVLQEGWQAVEKKFAPPPKRKRTEEEAALPILLQGQSVTVKKAQMQTKQTKPPAYYTESTLLSAMEHAGRFVEDETLKEQMKDSGLGTPATRAAIIERLLSVGYLYREGKNLLPTEKGKKLIAIVPDALRSPETTGRWEKGLSSIAKGKMTEERFMESIGRYVQFLVTDAAQNKKEIVFEAEPIRKGTKGRKPKKNNRMGRCPLCQKGEVLENSKAYYCTEWKNGCKFTIWKDSVLSYGITLEPAKVKKLLQEKCLQNIALVLPQTKEHAIAELALTADHSGKIEIKNITRIERE